MDKGKKVLIVEDEFNIGRLVHSLSLRAAPTSGRREVYLEHFREAGAAQDTLQIIRMQKWGVREHLDEGKDLLRAMIESEEYTDFIMDRRLGCRQLGMNLPPRILVRRVAERYDGTQKAARGITIRSPYFQREYVGGLASDKIPASKLRDPRYALALARLLGQAAAPNLVVGRTVEDGSTEAVFDTGDEMILVDGNGHPDRIVIADHAGTFNHFTHPLEIFAAAYAAPVVSRASKVPDPAAFAGVYLAALGERLTAIQDECRQRRTAFLALFQNSKQGPKTFADRWAKVLDRIDRTDVPALVARIRAEWGRPMTVIATGGLATLFAKASDVIEHIDTDLTLRGLLLIHNRNAGR